MDKLSPIFDEIQKSLVSHNSCAKQILNLLSIKDNHNGNTKSSDYFQLILEIFVDSILGISKKEPTVERVIKFVIDFFSSSNIEEKYFNQMIEHLLHRSMATDKNVRIRSCQLIAEILSKLNPDTEISDELWDKMSKTLLPRLRDKNVIVRTWSLKALSSFQSIDDIHDPVTLEIHRLMITDIASSVRSIAVEVISITNKTLPSIVDRVKDSCADVRLQVLNRCIEYIHCRQLSAISREIIVKHTLHDREQPVKDAAIHLIVKWITQLENKVPKLLHIMNLQLFENEAEGIGWTIIESIDMKKIKDQTLIQVILDQKPNWEGSFESLNASEVLWVRIRCDYARLKPESSFCIDILEHLLPDIVVLCDLLSDAKSSSLNNNPQQQLTMKYLLQMTSFIESSDSSGKEKLKLFGQTSLQDLTFPEHLIDTVLDAWSYSMDSDMILSRTKELAMNIKLKYNIDAMNDIHTMENMNIQNGNFDMILSTMRYLQIIAWMLTRAVSFSAGLYRDIKDFEDTIPLIQSCLQQPLVELRNQSVRCMGLLGMMSENLCMDNKEILMHVVSTDLEDASIRSYALQSLVDYAMVYPTIFINSIELINVLIRIQENNSDIQLATVASESSMKLFFSGVLSDTRLFAILLKEFFFPEITFIGSAEAAAVSTTDREFTSKLLQTLSIFFQTVFLMESNLLLLALQAIPELISDISMILRGSFHDDAISLGLDKVIHKILSLSDRAADSSTTSSTNNTMKMRFRATFCSCLCREILKLGNSKTDKMITKDYLKCLCSIAPDTWMNSTMKSQVTEVIGVLTSISMKFDKTTQNAIEKYFKACETTEIDPKVVMKDSTSVASSVINSTSVKIMEEGEERKEELCNSDFYALAPGLKDFVQVSSDNESFFGSTISKPVTNKSKNQKRRKVDDSDDEVDVENDHGNNKHNGDDDDDDDEQSEIDDDKMRVKGKVVKAKVKARNMESSSGRLPVRVSKSVAMTKLTASRMHNNDDDEEEDGKKEENVENDDNM